jgi:L-fucose mutarotase/ribose pyranase (RbsD/FucU family)
MDVREPHPACCMAVVGDAPQMAPIVTEFNEQLTGALGRSMSCWPLERAAFYQAARRA